MDQWSVPWIKFLRKEVNHRPYGWQPITGSSCSVINNEQAWNQKEKRIGICYRNPRDYGILESICYPRRQPLNSSRVLYFCSSNMTGLSTILHNQLKISINCNCRFLSSGRYISWAPFLTVNTTGSINTLAKKKTIN